MNMYMYKYNNCKTWMLKQGKFYDILINFYKNSQYFLWDRILNYPMCKDRHPVREKLSQTHI